METIFLKKEETKTIEVPIEIDVENCFFKAKYDQNYSQVDAFIGRFLKDGLYYTIEWHTRHGELNLKSYKDKLAYVGKTDFQSFINKFRNCEKIGDVEFAHAYEKIKTGYLLSNAAETVRIERDIKNVSEILEVLEEVAIEVQKEKTFTEAEISQLQSAVHKITGDGEVMQLFNSLLGVNAGSGS